ncbi:MULTISPECIES: ABC transporter substrate-binding protein [Brevibacillus]|uniref:ABC transporter substrate-binding protein n=1 Tax=Brevibacillus invocatus TaxID=173959 RepID=A0A3M8CLL2_9BACL|nr:MULTISPECIES: ABC transporter substrate-binding protein [Brevibacillus]MCM3080943.1 ABC transporter substrate-binding protein [Brevibacillus invocatus]MCM3431205.1 ABC transporter substrate-binding protein [Brevibacillus invocatus]MDH4618441.1 ABC transporter substrate-binding protein [Brevibacillus sp. AY1]RNB76554.1 ABC transporter substrate-binding protein [Brevibacillus invocatus]
MRTKKTWMTIFLAFSMVTGLAACSTSTISKPETNGSAEGNTQATELTVALDWYPNAVHSFLYAAQEQGYFKDENLNVHLQMPSDSNDPLKMVAAGQVDLAISYQTQLVAARAEGIPVLSVAALVRHPLNAIMTRKDSGLDSPEKLAGKAIGYPSIPFNESIVRTAVKHAGGDDSGLSFVDIGFDIVPALTGKKVDAVVGGYINHEQLILEKNGIELHVFPPTEFGVPDYYELVLTTSDDQYEQKKAVIEAFMRAAAKGQQYVKDNPKAALDLLLAKQAQEFPLEEDIETKSLETLLPLMDAEDKPFGYQTEESWQTLIDWMKEKSLITGEVKADQVMRNLSN